jgi:DMSO/TMAO reductase YedYZ molybdopterin-dependent catalytic subunit
MILCPYPNKNLPLIFILVTHWSKLDVKWTGIKVVDFMKQLVDFDPKATKATHLMQHCYGGYTTNIDMADFLREENFFAHTLFGEPLPADRGGPMRLLVPHLYAWKSAKWINGKQVFSRGRVGILGAQWLSSPRRTLG